VDLVGARVSRSYIYYNQISGPRWAFLVESGLGLDLQRRAL
jgi:hypothetical protein